MTEQQNNHPIDGTSEAAGVAVTEANERIWEALRGLVEAYRADTGDSAMSPLPPWAELSGPHQIAWMGYADEAIRDLTGAAMTLVHDPVFATIMSGLVATGEES